MDIDLWYDSVVAAAIDLDAPGAEDRIVPVIAQCLLQDKTSLEKWYDELSVDLNQTLVEGLNAIFLAEIDKPEMLDFYSSICMASISGQARALITSVVETNKGTLLDEALKHRDALARSSYTNIPSDEFPLSVKQRTV